MSLWAVDHGSSKTKQAVEHHSRVSGNTQPLDAEQLVHQHISVQRVFRNVIPLVGVGFG